MNSKKYTKILGGFCFCFLFAAVFYLNSLQVQAANNTPYVSFSPQSITKGEYSTPIWEQHTIWYKKSQPGRHGCGICTTAMALNLNGVACDPNTVLTMTGRNYYRCKALTAWESVVCLNNNGVPAQAISTRAYSAANCVNIMRNTLNEGKTVMCLVKGYPFSSGVHWVYLTGYASNGMVVVANSSYGGRKICRKTGCQYQIVNWNTIQKRVFRGKAKWSYMVIVG